VFRIIIGLSNELGIGCGKKCGRRSFNGRSDRVVGTG
jgi:hypothetical protein